MAKKIIDISVPRESKEKEVKEFYSQEKPEFKIPSSRIRLPKQLGRKIFLIPLILIIAGTVAYFSLSRADIEIWPETEVKTFETKLTVDKRIDNIDFSANLIPGTVFEEVKNFSQEFNSSGKKLVEKAAEGKILVYNNYNLPQTLVKYTRFQSPLEGICFCSTDLAVIPAKNQLDVNVYSCSCAPGTSGKLMGGEKYNIEPSDFSIPGLAGTSKYTAIYGKSSEAMKGGAKKEAPEVTQEDLDRAEKILREKALKETKDALKDKIPAGFTVAENGFEAEVLEISSLVQPESELEKFILQAKADARAISFKEEDLENFSKNFIASKIPADKEFDQKSLKMEYLSENINFEEGKITLSLNLEVKIYSAIDKISLKRGLAGKSLSETQLFLQNQPEIILTQVKFWPFWVNRVPDNLEKIKIELRVD